jgi:hypothetical protein
MVGHGQLSSKELQHAPAAQQSSASIPENVIADPEVNEAITRRKVLEFKVFHGFLIAFFFWVL